MTPASIVIPTRARLDYLEVALTSIAPQAAAAGAEVLVIDDAGPTPAARALAARLGARYEPHPGPLGLNVARNTGVERSTGELVVFVDDDVRVSPGWLSALLAAAGENPDVEVFTGPIRPALEGRLGWGRHSCGREGPPITTLALGPRDTDARYAWGANMTIRRGALERVGPFDVTLEHAGDEQEWQDRLRADTPGARVLYVAAAALDHRRAGADARLRSLARAAYARGRASRRFDQWRGEASSSMDGRIGGRVTGPLHELLTLAGCLGHVLRRRCPAGLVMVAHSAGRLRESLHTQPARTHSDDDFPSAEDFLSGASGTVGGVDALRRGAQDEAVNAWELASGRRLRLHLAARHAPPPRRVLVLCVERPAHRALAQAIQAELLRSRHDVELYTGAPGDLGKFENLNRLLAERVGGLPLAERVGGFPPAERVGGFPLQSHDWLLLVDDDVLLPRGFLDRFLFLAERFSLDLAQPAHRLNSHAAWPLTRRRPFSVARETGFVEIGPVTALARRTFSTLLPFPELRMGWGLDAHWAALARDQDWRCGVLDAVSIRHRAAPAGAAYSREAAVAEARAFLAERPYLSASETQRTLTTHRRW
jgi:GT2 family glycosyltransferase